MTTEESIKQIIAHVEAGNRPEWLRLAVIQTILSQRPIQQGDIADIGWGLLNWCVRHPGIELDGFYCGEFRATVGPPTDRSFSGEPLPCMWQTYLERTTS